MPSRREAGDALETQTSQAGPASSLGRHKGTKAASELKKVDPSVRRADSDKTEGIEQEKSLEAGNMAGAVHPAKEVDEKCFISNAQLLRRLMAAERALARSTKVVVPRNTEVAKLGDTSAGTPSLPGLASTAEAAKPEASDRRGSREPLFKRNGSR